MSFLGIKITHEIGRLLQNIDVPGEKISPSEMHITLLHFEENWPISEIAKALETTYDVVSDIKPFIVETDSVTCFGTDKPAIVALIKSAELHEMREKLAKEFDKCKIEFSNNFPDYKPHITLSYNDEKIKDFEFDKLEFSVSEVVLWGGDHGDDRIFITFPLKGPEKQKNSLLLQRAEIFEKMANNPDQDYFFPTSERRKIER